MTTLHRKVQARLPVRLVNLTEQLLLVTFPLSHEMNNSARVTSFTEVKEGSNITHTLRVD